MKTCTLPPFGMGSLEARLFSKTIVAQSLNAGRIAKSQRLNLFHYSQLWTNQTYNYKTQLTEKVRGDRFLPAQTHLASTL